MRQRIVCDGLEWAMDVTRDLKRLSAITTFLNRGHMYLYPTEYARLFVLDHLCQAAVKKKMYIEADETAGRDL